VRDGSDLTIIANGLMVAAALDAATLLAKDGINARVLDMHTIKPIDADAIAAAARETGAIVVAEEHLHHGGLGAVVAQTAASLHPVPIEFVNVGDTYAESGDPDGLLIKYGLTAENVAAASRRARQRKTR
jgi:transketolase